MFTDHGEIKLRNQLERKKKERNSLNIGKLSNIFLSYQAIYFQIILVPKKIKNKEKKAFTIKYI